MIGVLKKFLIFLLILTAASVLFSPKEDSSSPNAEEVVEIIDTNSSYYENGYISEDEVVEKDSNNIFVSIVKTIANLISNLIEAIFDLVRKLFSLFI